MRCCVAFFFSLSQTQQLAFESVLQLHVSYVSKQSSAGPLIIKVQCRALCGTYI